MKKTLLILTTIIALTGCVSTTKYSSYVTQKLEQQIHAPDIQDKNISFDFSKLQVLDNSVEAEKSKSFFIPAILYWGWENTIQCKINPNLIEKSFKLTFLHCADSIGLLNNLEGKKLLVLDDIKDIDNNQEKIKSILELKHKGYSILLTSREEIEKVKI